ncbi:MAG TPA: hypothetical protein VKG38_07210 [Solirubrobacteraceae bacterium]|nr:hypothetical protein [Solirubrobacteraceae bacterium]
MTSFIVCPVDDFADVEHVRADRRQDGLNARVLRGGGSDHDRDVPASAPRTPQLTGASISSAACLVSSAAMARVAFGAPDVWPTISVPGFSFRSASQASSIGAATIARVGSSTTGCRTAAWPRSGSTQKT